MSAVFPISLKVAGRRCIVVGGGGIAELKVSSLLVCDAKVVVISPDLTSGLAQWKAEGTIEHVQREYRPGDLKDAFLVVSATDNSETHRAVFQEAKNGNMLINVVDVPELCDFYYPSVLRRGALTISIATEGKSPALASALREQLEMEFDEGHAELLELFGSMREEIKSKCPTFSQRRNVWRRIVARRDQIIDLLRSGDRNGAEECIRACIC